jgi:pyruvate dehydrogenase E2 component (dihydrolipoamide acetyltransferase)
MAREFRLPDLGEGVHEGEIVSVLVAVGDRVEEDEPILEVETDKAAVEITSPFSGTVTEIMVEPGNLVNVGDVLITFDGGTRSTREPRARLEGAEKAAWVEPQVEPEKPDLDRKRPSGPVPASPATRRLARELGVDLYKVTGSGAGGRVTAEDVRAFAQRGREDVEDLSKPEEVAPEEQPTQRGISPGLAAGHLVPELPDFSRWGEVERVPLRSIRRATAKHMALAWSQIPHVSHQDVADITELDALRQKHKDDIAEQGGRLTMTVFVIKAAVAALKAHPRFNASFDIEAQEIVLKKYYNIGVAVDTERGLLVPVVRDVDCKTIPELAIELRELVTRTREGNASIEDLHGGTFTITNPGSLGGTGFAAIVNYPEVAILGMARAGWQPVVRGEGKNARIVPRFLLPLGLSFDHRIADGADAARFVTTIIESLKDPGNMLMRV